MVSWTCVSLSVTRFAIYAPVVVRESAPSMTPSEKFIAILLGEWQVSGKYRHRCGAEDENSEKGFYMEVPRLSRVSQKVHHRRSELHWRTLLRRASGGPCQHVSHLFQEELTFWQLRVVSLQKYHLLSAFLSQETPSPITLDWKLAERFWDRFRGWVVNIFLSVYLLFHSIAQTEKLQRFWSRFGFGFVREFNRL